MLEEFKEGTWLIAVSTGADSMALLDLALSAGVQVAVAHVNYHHQVQAEEEENYIRTYCKDKGIVLHVFSAPKELKGNFEAEARRIRYSFFARIVRENGYSGVLIGHHQDDLLETYLMQKEKDLIPSVWGLGERVQIEGIPVVRPLLDLSHEQLILYCKEKGIRWFEDETNQDLSYARNRVRAERVSGLTSMEREALVQRIKEENEKMQREREEASAFLVHGSVSLAVYRTLKEPVRLTLVYQLIKVHVSLGFAQQIDQMLCTKKDVLIPVGNRWLVQERGCVFVIDEPSSYHMVFETLKEVPIGLEAESFAIVPGRPGVSAVTVSEEDFPLILRCAEEGDEILMRFGTKKVNRFFIDRHIPRYMRRTWPVLVNKEGRVIFVAGLGCDVHHHAVSPSFSVLQCLHYMEDLSNE